MKGKIFASGVLICIALASNGQKLWEKVYSQREFELSRSNSSTLVGDSMIVFSGVKSFWYCPGNFLGAVSVAGDPIWSIKDQFSWDCGYINCSGKYSQIAHLGESIYGVGEAFLGGIIDEKIPISIFKWSLDGEKVFHKWYHNENWPHYYLFKPVHLDVNEEEGILVTDGNSSGGLIKIDLNGNVVWDKKYESIITKAIFINKSNLALISGKKLYISNSEGEISLQLNFDDDISDVIYSNNQFFVLGPKRVYLIDNETYQPTLTRSSGEAISQIKIFNNELWLLKQMNDSTKVINHSTEESFLFLMSNFNVTDFYVTNTEVIFLGTTMQQQMALIAYGREETNPDIIFPDIELVDFEISNPSFRYHPHSPFENPYIADYDAQITIRNNGSETIDSVGVFDAKYYISDCGKHPFYQFLTELALHPNQEITIDLERSADYIYREYTLKICLDLLAPNSRLEPNIKNNKKCKTFDFTNIPELTNNEQWRVYPNPSTSYITINTPESMPFKYSIYSIEGKIIMDGENCERSSTLDISGLPVGLYFLRLQQGKNVRTLKLVRH